MSHVIAKQPALSPKNVKEKVEEILKAHVHHKEISKEIVERSFVNFLDVLDPMKTYLLDSEVSMWTSPEESYLARVSSELKKGNYGEFHKIYQVFLKAIERRRALDELVSSEALPKGVTSEEFKDLTWALDEESLKTRVLRIKALQMETASKLGDEAKEKFLQRLEKRKLNQESEFLEPDPEERERLVLSSALKSLTASLDSHTNYFTPSEANQFMIQVQQRLFGIGAQLHDNLDGLVVKRILENSPASQSNKIKLGDKIIAVNHEPVVGLDITEAVELIRGEKGTPVLLTVLREIDEGEEKRVQKLNLELVRGEVVIEESRLETVLEPFGDGVIANLKLFSFYQDTKSSSGSDVRRAIEKIKKEHNLKGVLLDLRGNSGGLLTQAVSVCGLFMNKGVVVSIQDHTGRLQHLREVEGKPVWEGPLVTLVNRASASAAEIVAQTLQDYGRALVVGDKNTFGKGSFQTFTLDAIQGQKINPQGEYKVTRGRYYTVSGKSPQLTGVEADLEVPGLLSQIEIGEKFAKFPLENDSIDPRFEDDLSDLSQFQRLQLGPMYRYNLQQKKEDYLPILERLKTNSSKRLSENKSYQNFLKEIEKKNFDSEAMDFFMQSDLQLLEAMNVMKDVVYLMEIEASR